LSKTDPMSVRVRHALERTVGGGRKEFVGADAPV
jgi:hypothetical protein